MAILKPNKITRVAEGGTREKEITFTYGEGDDAIQIRMRRPNPLGPAFEAIMNPNEFEIEREAEKWAKHNGRPLVRIEGTKDMQHLAYERQVLLGSMAIQKCYVHDEGEDELELSTLLNLYDGEGTQLWHLMQNHAYELMGFMQFTRPNSGYSGWIMLRELMRKLVRTEGVKIPADLWEGITNAIRMALTDFTLDPSETEVDMPDSNDLRDAMVEGFRGNSSAGPGS